MIIFFQSQGLNHSINLAIFVLQVIGAFFFLLLACEFGARITSTYDDIDYAMLQLSWYNFPAKLQHILPTFISIVQKDVMTCGIGSFVCSRETFKRVSC